MSESKAWIAGTSGLKLTPDEIAFFRDERPWGFILFARNVSEPAQIEDLCAHLRDLVRRDDALVLIDQAAAARTELSFGIGVRRAFPGRRRKRSARSVAAFPSACIRSVEAWDQRRLPAGTRRSG
jgi:beta-glucosidase-like glycosyl hydrolase